MRSNIANSATGLRLEKNQCVHQANIWGWNMQRPVAPEKLEHSELFAVAEGQGARGCDCMSRAKSWGDWVLKEFRLYPGLRGRGLFFSFP